MLQFCIKASLPIQEYLQLPLDKKRKEHALAELLPGYFDPRGSICLHSIILFQSTLHIVCTSQCLC